jgi:hypothetical protein
MKSKYPVKLKHSKVDITKDENGILFDPTMTIRISMD